MQAWDMKIIHQKKFGENYFHLKWLKLQKKTNSGIMQSQKKAGGSPFK